MDTGIVLAGGAHYREDCRTCCRNRAACCHGCGSPHMCGDGNRAISGRIRPDAARTPLVAPALNRAPQRPESRPNYGLGQSRTAVFRFLIRDPRVYFFPSADFSQTSLGERSAFGAAVDRRPDASVFIRLAFGPCPDLIGFIRRPGLCRAAALMGDDAGIAARSAAAAGG